MAREDSTVRAWTSLRSTYREMSKLIDEQLRAASPCSLSDFDVLNEVYCTPQRRMQMLTLADRLGVSRGGLTRIVDRLVERGWLDRDRPPANRREVYAVVTDDGARVVVEARAVYVRLLTGTLGTHLDDAALDRLSTTIDTLRAGLLTSPRAAVARA